MSLYEDLKAALKVSKHNLDTHFEEQAQLNSTIGEEHEKALRARDLAKQELDELSAEIDAELRADATAAGEKVTETALKNRITLDPRMRKLERRVLDLNLEVGRWASLRESFRQRSDALKGLTNLNGQNYFVATGAGRDMREAKERGADKVRSQGAQRFRRERE